jgi:hypothetical protein
MSGYSGDVVPGPVLEFLLLALIPSGNIRKVACDPRDLGYVVRAAEGADRLAAERAVFNGFYDIVGTVAVIEGAHDLQVHLAAVGAGAFIDDVVARETLVAAFFDRNILK